jgi:ankyrin repeat protein
MSRANAFLLTVVILVSLAVATQGIAQSHDRVLHDAVRDGDLVRVKKLLDDGADVDAPVENNLTPIFFAQDPKIVDLLLARKPKLNFRCAAGLQTPLENAAEQFYLDKARAGAWRTIVDKLRAAGAEYTVDAAIYMNDVDYIRQRLEKDDSWVNKRRGAQSVPLRIAARTGRTETCQLLLQHKADPSDFEKGNGYPIVYDAVNHPAVVKLLIGAGANLRRRVTWLGGRTGVWIIGDEATALHHAASVGNAESVQLLIKAGVDVNAADVDGQTPLHIALIFERFGRAHEEAADKRFAKTIRYLLENEASLRFRDKRDRTPLELAKQIQSPKDIRKLLEECDRERRTKQGIGRSDDE